MDELRREFSCAHSNVPFLGNVYCTLYIGAFDLPSERVSARA